MAAAIRLKFCRRENIDCNIAQKALSAHLGGYKFQLMGHELKGKFMVRNEKRQTKVNKSTFAH